MRKERFIQDINNRGKKVERHNSSNLRRGNAQAYQEFNEDLELSQQRIPLDRKLSQHDIRKSPNNQVPSRQRQINPNTNDSNTEGKRQSMLLGLFNQVHRLGEVLADEDKSDLSGAEQDDIEEEMQEMMETIHPLRNKKLEEIFPFLRWFIKTPEARWKNISSQINKSQLEKTAPLSQNQSSVESKSNGNQGFIEKSKKKGFDLYKKKSMIRKKLVKNVSAGTKDTLNKITNSDDPLSALGIGINAYHNYMHMLWFLFVLLILLHIPAIRSFKSYSHYDNEGSGSIMMRRTLGNLGYSSMQCIHAQMVNGNHKEFMCPTGQITQLIDWGINLETEGALSCENTNDNYCQHFLEKEKVSQLFEENCKGKDRCTFQDFQSLVKEPQNPDRKSCVESSSRIFFQFTCIQTQEQLDTKQAIADFNVDLEVLTAIFMAIFSYYSVIWTKQATVRYDEKTVTVSDYSLFFPLDRDQNKAFKEIFYDPQSEDGRGRQMVYWIWNQLNIFSKDDRVKIARMDLVFDIGKMVSIQKKRGLAIKFGKLDEVTQLESEISAEKWKLFESDICGIFIIFETDKDVKTAQREINNPKKNVDVEIFGKKLLVERASEPSDYEWSNMIYTNRYQKVMKFVVMTILFLVLVLGYNGQLSLQKSMTSGDKYVQMNCLLYDDSLPDVKEEHDFLVNKLDQLGNSFTLNNLAKEEDIEPQGFKIPGFSRPRYQIEAFTTYDKFYNPKDISGSNQMFINGTLSCFCDNEYKQKGIRSAFRQYFEDGRDQMPQELQTHFQNQNPLANSEQICLNYTIFHTYGRFYYYMITIFILVWNTLLYMIIEPLINLIGLHHKTETSSIVMLTVFVCLCADMLALPNIIGFNFSEHFEDKITGVFAKGKFTDFSAGWYLEVGHQMQVTLFTFTLMPIVMLYVEFMQIKKYRTDLKKTVYNRQRMEKNGLLKHPSNRLLKFLDLNTGPDYLIQYKTSNTIICVFSCLIFGQALPMLYVLGLFALSIQYIIDRLSLTYFYRLPPKFSASMTIQMIRIMGLVPLFHLPLTLWLYTNKQMFDNKIEAIQDLGQVQLSFHYLQDLKWDNLNGHLRFLVVVWIIIASFLAWQILLFKSERLLNYVGLSDTSLALKFREALLPSFFHALPKNFLEDLIDDEKHFRKCKFKMLEDECFEKCERIDKQENIIQQESSVIIGSDKNDLTKQKLKNQMPCYQLYRSSDWFVQCNNHNHDDEIACKLLLLMPMMTHEEAKKIRVNYLERRNTCDIKHINPANDLGFNPYNDQSREQSSQDSDSMRDQSHSNNNQQ